MAAARAAGRVLMVGHLLEYHPGVVRLKELADSGELGAITRSGDIWSPRLSNAEPLRAECGHFVDCIREGRAPVSGAESGLRVVRVLERLQRALDDTRRSSATASIAAP